MSRAPVRLLAPAAFSRALEALAGAAPGLSLAFDYGPATGPSAQSVTSRLRAGSEADFVILPKALAEAEQAAGLLSALSPFAASPVAFCVPAAAETPDLSTLASLSAFLESCASIGISTAGSGVFFKGALLDRLNLRDRLGAKIHEITDRPVGKAVVEGAVAAGFQQKAELLEIEGLQVLTDLPEPARNDTPLVLGQIAGSASAYRLPLLRALREDAEVQKLLSDHGLIAAM